MANWKDNAIAKMIQGAPGQGKNEVFINEYGHLVDNNGLPIYNTQGTGGMISVNPESYGVKAIMGQSKLPIKKGGGFSSKKAPIVNNEVQSPWEALAKEPDVGYRPGPGISEQKKVSPEEADLLRRLYGY